jgi:hypothetical protein
MEIIMTIFDEKIFLTNEFSIFCPLIKLIPIVEESKIIQHEGPGEINISKEGELNFRIITDKVISFEEVFLLTDHNTGKIIGDEFYVKLIAIDLDGVEWVSDKILITINTSKNGSIIFGKILQIYCKNQAPVRSKTNFIQIYFRKKIAICYNTFVKTEKYVNGKKKSWNANLTIAKFSYSDMDFEIEGAEDWTRLSVYSMKVIFDDILINRIIEAFRFIIADTLPWAIIKISNGFHSELRLRGERIDKKTSRIGPPISLINTPPSQTHDVWKLFKKFLNFIAKNTKDNWHIISNLNNAIIDSSKSSINVEALTLSANIENLLKIRFKEINTINDELNENIDQAIEIIHDASLDENFKKRLHGTITAMKDVRAKDILILLRSHNLIDSKFIKKYEKLRNKSVHGEFKTWVDLQEFIDHCSSAVVLYYQLIFLIIGYCGPYTDYSSYKYPIKKFNKSFRQKNEFS